MLRQRRGPPLPVVSAAGLVSACLGWSPSLATAPPAGAAGARSQSSTALVSACPSGTPPAPLGLKASFPVPPAQPLGGFSNRTW